MIINEKCCKCGDDLKFRFIQPALLKTQSDKIMVDCVNPDCELYLSTWSTVGHKQENDKKRVK